MALAEDFPIWDQLTADQQACLSGAAVRRSVPRGTMLAGGGTDCAGLLLVHSGQLRAYILSEGGREITLYRLFDLDMCLFSASCVMRSLQFEVMVQAEKDTDLWMIPPEVYRALMESSAPVSNYTGEVMAARFSEVMWLMEQILWKSVDTRLAAFLLEESALEGSRRLRVTHEGLANHLGTAREVVTRMLRYFQDEGLVRLSRGCVELTDPAGLAALSGK